MVGPNEEPKILFLDIESIPDVDAAFDRWTTLSRWYDITFSADLQSIACFGYKWAHEKRAKIINAWDFPAWKVSINQDHALCKALFEVIKEADVVVTQNGKKFDWPFIQTRLLLNKLPPLPPIVHIDTKAEAKRHLKLSSKSLKNMGQLFTEERKMENGGWDLWIATRKRDPKAMKLMSAYCKQDVITLEAIFNRMKPLIKGLPNANMFHLENSRCPSCSSLALQKRGQAMTKTQVKQRFQCMECGAWSTASMRERFPR